MDKHTGKISEEWIKNTLELFKNFLCETDFPNPLRMGERVPNFVYPEWLIMFIAILAVKLKIKSYVKIHQTAVQYWDVIEEGPRAEPDQRKTTEGSLKKNLPFPWKISSVRFSNFSLSL